MPKRKPKKQQPDFVVNSKAVCVMVDVDNPFYSSTHDGVKGNARYVRAIRNINESPHAWYANRGWITPPQAEAADRFRQLYERCAGSGLKAFDYTKEPVDGGLVSDGLTDARMRAAKELKGAYEKLGHSGYDLVEQVCGHLTWVKQMTRNSYEAKQMMDLFRDALTTLSIYWGYQSTAQGRKKQGLRVHHY